MKIGFKCKCHDGFKLNNDNKTCSGLLSRPLSNDYFPLQSSTNVSNCPANAIIAVKSLQSARSVAVASTDGCFALTIHTAASWNRRKRIVCNVSLQESFLSDSDARVLVANTHYIRSVTLDGDQETLFTRGYDKVTLMDIHVERGRDILACFKMIGFLFVAEHQ